MWIISSIILLCCLFTWMYVRWTRVRTYWKRRNIPHLPPHPVLGSLTFMRKKYIGTWMRDIYNQFKTPYIGIWLYWRPALIVNTPDIARRILIKDSDVFRDRFVSSGKTDPIGGLNIFTLNDPLWSSVRRRLTAVFTTAKLKVMQDLIRRKSKELCQRVTTESEKNKKYEIRQLFADFSTDIIGSAAFGVNCNATLTGNDAMRKVTQDFQTYNMFRGFAFSCIFFFPKLVDIFRLAFLPKSATDYFRKIFKAVVEQRGGYKQPVKETRDLLDYLLKIKQDAAKENEELPEDLLVAQAAIFVQAGFDTTSSTLTYTFYELAYNPEAQEKLYRDILDIKNNFGDNDFDMESLSNAVYLNCVIKDTLRKYPSMGWLDRIAGKDYKIDTNVTIPAGTPVYVNATAMHVDPKYFPEPEKFIPERFLPENEKNIKQFTYLPFGEGPRICIGKRFAEQTMRFSIANLVLNFKLRPWPDAPLPNDARLEVYSPFLLPGEILSVQFVPRK